MCLISMPADAMALSGLDDFVALDLIGSEQQTEETAEAGKPAEENAEAEKPEPREQDAAAAAMAAAASLMNEVEIDDDRPIHQQLFSVQEEPCIMPLPPEGAGGNPEESAGSVTEAEAVPEQEKKEIPETAETPEIPETADNPFTDEIIGTERFRIREQNNIFGRKNSLSGSGSGKRKREDFLSAFRIIKEELTGTDCAEAGPSG